MLVAATTGIAAGGAPPTARAVAVQVVDARSPDDPGRLLRLGVVRVPRRRLGRQLPGHHDDERTPVHGDRPGLRDQPARGRGPGVCRVGGHSRDGAGHGSPERRLRRRDRIRDRERRCGGRLVGLARRHPGHRLRDHRPARRRLAAERGRLPRVRGGPRPAPRRRLARPPGRHRGPRRLRRRGHQPGHRCTRSRRQGRAARTSDGHDHHHSERRGRRLAAADRAAAVRHRGRAGHRRRRPPGQRRDAPGRLLAGSADRRRDEGGAARPELPLPAGRRRALPERLRCAARGHALQPGHRPLRAPRHAGARSPRRHAGAGRLEQHRRSPGVAARQRREPLLLRAPLGLRPGRQDGRAGACRRRDRLPRRLGRRAGHGVPPALRDPSGREVGRAAVRVRERVARQLGAARWRDAGARAPGRARPARIVRHLDLDGPRSPDRSSPPPNGPSDLAGGTAAIVGGQPLPSVSQLLAPSQPGDPFQTGG